MRNISRTVESFDFGRTVSNVEDLASLVENKWNKKNKNYGY